MDGTNASLSKRSAIAKLQRLKSPEAASLPLIAALGSGIRLLQLLVAPPLSARSPAPLKRGLLLVPGPYLGV